MPATNRVKASTPVYQQDGVRANVPALVRNHLGARVGDTLVFEEGCEASVQRAALRGRYFVVRAERAPEQAERQPEAMEMQADTPAVESFAEAVRRKLNEEYMERS